MKVCKAVLAAFAAGLVGLSAHALVVDRDMTITTAPDGIEFAGDYTLTVAADIFVGVITNDGHRATLRLNSKTQIRWINGLNGSSTRVEFNGGALTDAGGWGGAWFKPDATSTIELASIDGKPIQILHPNSQWQYLSNGAGKIITSGTGRFEVATAGVLGSTILFCYLNIPSANYGHTGGTFLRGNTTGILGNIAFNSNNSMPRGEVSLGSSSGYSCRVLMGATSHYADRIIGYGSSYLTNETSTACSLTFTNDNSCLDAVLSGPSFNVTMNGAQPTDVFTLKTPRVSGVFTVQSGKAVVRKPASGATLVTCDTVTLGALGTLRIDGVTLQAKALQNQGGTLECVNGGKLQYQTVVKDQVNRLNSDDFPFASCDLVKTGARPAFFCSTNALAVRSLRVAEGTVNFAGDGNYTTNKFWRFTVKATATANNVLHLIPVRLYDANNAFCDGGSAAGGNAECYTMHFTSDANPPVVSDLQANHVLFSANAASYAATSDASGVWTRPPWVMFTASTIYNCRFTSLKPVVTTPSSWLVAAYRVPNDVTPATGYDIRSAWSGTDYYPGTWTLESSPTGADGTWEIMDEKSGQRASNGQTWYHGGANGNSSTSPYPIMAAMNTRGGGFSPTMNVQVDGGATIDCTRCAARQKLTALTVDTSLGGGTLVNVSLAATGRLYLTNYTGKSGLELPLTFVDSVTTGSLDGWKVYVNGVLRPGYRLAWEDGQLVIPKVGLTILVK